MQVMNRVCRTRDPDQQIDTLASSIESRKKLETWGGTDQGASRARIADKKDRSPSPGIMGRFRGNKDRSASNADEAARGNKDSAPTSQLGERQSYVPGLLESNAGVFNQTGNNHKW